MIDKGDYFIVYPNYPDSSDEATREYKWTPNGKWKKYDEEKGILLILTENKDKVVTSDGVVIKDSNGNEYKKVYFEDLH